MTIYDFCYLCTDDSVEIAIYDFTTEEEIFTGSLRDADFEHGDLEVLSFDITPPDSRGITLILNVETESEED